MDKKLVLIVIVSVIVGLLIGVVIGKNVDFFEDMPEVSAGLFGGATKKITDTGKSVADTGKKVKNTVTKRCSAGRIPDLKGGCMCNIPAMWNSDIKSCVCQTAGTIGPFMYYDMDGKKCTTCPKNKPYNMHLNACIDDPTPHYENLQKCLKKGQIYDIKNKKCKSCPKDAEFNPRYNRCD